MTHVVSADELTLDASCLPTIFLNSQRSTGAAQVGRYWLESAVPAA